MPTAARSDLRLLLPAEAESAAVLRALVRGLEGLLAPRAGLLDDVISAVSEAANNVVAHAYGASSGPLQLDVFIRAPLELWVRDWGRGPGGGPHAEPRPGEVGLIAMRSWADEVEVRPAPDRGTEVRLRWHAPHLARELRSAPERERILTGGIVLSGVPARLLDGVAGRVVALIAARAHFTVDRLGDARRVGDALGRAAGPLLDGGHLALALQIAPHELQLRAGPLRPGEAGRLRDAVQAGDIALLGRLAAEFRVLPADRRSGESLAVALRDRR
jgi:anti-sigma regulatory factor (Ser/Thr protein kinase)